MILNDREIQTAIGAGSIVIDPAPAERAYSSTSVDLTLDPILSIFKKEKPNAAIKSAIDPSVDNFNAEETIKSLTDTHIISDDGYALKTKELILAYTVEYIDLRNDP